MNYKKYYLLITAILGFALFSCSDVRNDITPPSKVTVHGSEVLVKASPSFHGRQLVDGSMESCKLCHASDLSGGTAGVGCNTTNCHPAINVHTAGFKTVGNPAFHGRYIANSNWNMAQCSQCHGSDYTGGVASPSCTKCHTESGGPEACNTCHGDFANASSAAPPQALDNATETTDPGVGAHQAHLNPNDLMTTIECNECHIVPSKFSSAGHIDNTPHAEVTFGNQTGKA